MLTKQHLGRGQFGEVVLSKKDDDKFFACKVMQKAKLKGHLMKQL